MRVRLTRENFGHRLSKIIDLAEVPVVGAILRSHGRAVAAVAYDAEHDIYDVALVEEHRDLEMYVQPEWYLQWLDAAKKDGWAIEGEAELRAKMRARLFG